MAIGCFIFLLLAGILVCIKVLLSCFIEIRWKYADLLLVAFGLTLVCCFLIESCLHCGG